MSIVTKTGDLGTTGLMYNRRVAKTHPQVEAYGAVDEFTSALGLARAAAIDEPSRATLLDIQKTLVSVMGELATASEDQGRYLRDGYPRVNAEQTARVEREIAAIEARGIAFKGWAMPGGNAYAAALDMARTICRRAERRVCALQEAGQLANPEIIVYLNRLSDLCWLMARVAEN